MFTDLIDTINKSFSEPVLGVLGVDDCCCPPEYLSIGMIVAVVGFVALQMVNFVGSKVSSNEFTTMGGNTSSGPGKTNVYA